MVDIFKNVWSKISGSPTRKSPIKSNKVSPWPHWTHRWCSVLVGSSWFYLGQMSRWEHVPNWSSRQPKFRDRLQLPCKNDSLLTLNWFDTCQPLHQARSRWGLAKISSASDGKWLLYSTDRTTRVTKLLGLKTTDRPKKGALLPWIHLVSLIWNMRMPCVRTFQNSTNVGLSWCRETCPPEFPMAVFQDIVLGADIALFLSGCEFSTHRWQTCPWSKWSNSWDPTSGTTYTSAFAMRSLQETSQGLCQHTPKKMIQICILFGQNQWKTSWSSW